MRLCRFNDNRLGIVLGDRIADVTEALEVIPACGYPPPAYDALIANLDVVRVKAEQLVNTAPRLPVKEVSLLSPVAAPGKLIGAPVNYAKHMEEAAADDGIHHGNEAHLFPIRKAGLFLKATSALIGPSDPVRLRFPDRRTDHEVELAVIIGSTASNVTATEAMEYVAGYAIGLDMTVRGPQDRSFRKSVDSYAVLGPWLVTADEIANPGTLDFKLTVNGQIRQKSNTRNLLLGVAELIEFASAYYTLMPGDVIFTGTPEGVGPVEPGDEMLASFDEIGEMTITVARHEPRFVT